MVDSEWRTLQAKKMGFNLNRILNPEFIDELNKEFEDKKIDAINISFVVHNSEIDLESTQDVDVISIMNKNINDTINEEVLLDASDSKNFEIVKKVIDNF